MRISGFSSLFSAIAVFLDPPKDVLKMLRSLRKERKTQKSSLIGKEKVNKESCSDFPLRQKIATAIAEKSRRLVHSGLTFAHYVACLQCGQKSRGEIFHETMGGGHHGECRVLVGEILLSLFSPGNEAR